MNIIYKLYCRTFQFCLKLALPFLPYKNPIILNNILDVGDELIKNNKKNPIIIVDKIIYELGLVKSLEDKLKELHYKYSIFTNVVVNPTTNSVEKALMLYKANSCDSIIAIGGGSAIDLAKGMGALIAKKNKILSQLKGILHIRKKIPLLFAIPTTAGTGSETTLACVIVDSETRHKYAINDFPLIPKYAVLDANMTMTLPQNLVATTGMDALTHAIEAYIGKSGNKNTRKDAKQAIKLIFSNIEKSYFDTDIEARKNMLYASHLAGRAFSKAYVGNVHSIAHSLGEKYNLPHGLCNAVILPYVLKEYGKSIYKKIKQISLYCGFVDDNVSLEDTYNLFINKIIDLNKKMNIPNHLPINGADIDEMVNYAYKETNPLYPVPELWNKEKFKKIYMLVGDINEKRNN